MRETTHRNNDGQMWLGIHLKVQTGRKTRNLSYCKDDRAMRPIYECPEKNRESLTMATATFPEIFNGLFFRLML